MAIDPVGPTDLVSSILSLIGRAFLAPVTTLIEELMATTAELQTKVDSLRTDIQAAADRSIAFAADMKQQIADLRAQLEAAQVPPELLAQLDTMDQTVRGIDPTDPNVIPTPGPTPAPTPVPPPPS